MDAFRPTGFTAYRILHLLLLVCATSMSAQAADSTDEFIDLEPKDASRDRTVPIRVRLPEQATPAPVILFSHGLGGSRKNSRYVVDHWRDSGYVCVNLQHAGSDEEVWRSARPADMFSQLKQAANARSFLDRIVDVSFVLDRLADWNSQADHPLNGRLNLDKIGMSGHSFGSVTTMAMAGSKLGFRGGQREPRIDAFLAMSPQTQGRIAPERVFGKVSRPVFTMTGTEDKSAIDPNVTPETRREVYAALPAGDKYELVFDGAQHHAFGDDLGRRPRSRDKAHHPIIQSLSLKFWDAYLKNDDEAKNWLQSDQPEAVAGFKRSDVWDWK